MQSDKKTKPRVSILIPCYNEQDYIKQCLDSLIDDFVVKNAEILIVDGMSVDGTRKVIKNYIDGHKNVRIKLLDNPKKLQAYGLNIGIDNAKGEVIVRADTHAGYPKEYVKRCVSLLKKTDADNVGGAMYPWGEGSKFQDLMALALMHPFGVGDAKFHLGNYTGYVDTVYLGTFWKSVFREIGHFDPASHPNEDAELNLRILNAGGKIYLDSSIKIDYFPRNSLSSLIVQYFNYGRGRCRTILKHKKITSFRQAVPVFLVLGLFISLVAGLIANSVFLLFPLVYLSSVILISLLTVIREQKKITDLFLLSIIFIAMHISWGLGFLAKLLRLTK